MEEILGQLLRLLPFFLVVMWFIRRSGRATRRRMQGRPPESDAGGDTPGVRGSFRTPADESLDPKVSKPEHDQKAARFSVKNRFAQSESHSPDAGIWHAFSEESTSRKMLDDALNKPGDIIDVSLDDRQRAVKPERTPSPEITRLAFGSDEKRSGSPADGRKNGRAEVSRRMNLEQINRLSPLARGMVWSFILEDPPSLGAPR